MSEEEKELILEPRPKRQGSNSLAIILSTTIAAATSAAIIYFNYEVNLIRTHVTKQTEDQVIVLKALDEIITQKATLSEILEAFKHAPKSTSEEIIKKANKFDLIKKIYITKEKALSTADLENELLAISKLTTPNNHEHLNNFTLTYLPLLKSNSEILKFIETINLESTSKGEESNIDVIQNYLSKIVKIKRTSAYKQEQLLNKSLLQVKEALKTNDIYLANNALKHITVHSEQLNLLKEYINARIQLDSLLNGILKDIMQNV
jgi:hypothetical protein